MSDCLTPRGQRARRTDQTWQAPHLLGSACASGPPSETPSLRCRTPIRDNSEAIFLVNPTAFLSLGEGNSIPFVRSCRRSSASLFVSGIFLQTGPWRFRVRLLLKSLFTEVRHSPRHPRQRCDFLLGEHAATTASHWGCLVTSNSPSLSDPSTQPRLRDVLIRLVLYRFEPVCDCNTSKLLRKSRTSRMMAAEPTPQGSVEDTATPAVLRVSDSLASPCLPLPVMPP